MKLRWLFAVLMVFTLVFNQCASDETEETSESISPEEQKEMEQQIEHISMLNKELTGGKPENELVAAKALFDAASKFVNTHPNHEKTPAIMELAAKSSEILGKPQQAINIMQKLVDEFPETEDTPKYMANIARLYEVNGELEKSKSMYNQLIEKYPNDPFAQDAKNYLTNILGKSDAEILMFIDSVNSSN
ncbi:tetratricopeptide repeat protein [Parvicella tangerina]|uniref:Cell division coordinator CpoB n=1 Tax=Parvicella tangerina TaxID=2829795 RepID=A0A916JNM8_9FLAO|nr:tetratricopeptide repeat protein [Parvicella tangerina]CAG5083135.1 Cell division coordinator CpoB [Parvicella tangerina]